MFLLLNNFYFNFLYNFSSISAFYASAAWSNYSMVFSICLIEIKILFKFRSFSIWSIPLSTARARTRISFFLSRQFKSFVFVKQNRNSLFGLERLYFEKSGRMTFLWGTSPCFTAFSSSPSPFSSCSHKSSLVKYVPLKRAYLL